LGIYQLFLQPRSLSLTDGRGPWTIFVINAVSPIVITFRSSVRVVAANQSKQNEFDHITAKMERLRFQIEAVNVAALPSRSSEWCRK
jgi:ABC-type sulfate transport system substrate-binding protein